MANYLLLYKGGGMPESEAAGKLVMAAWGDWMKTVGENLVDAGNPCSNSKSVTQGGETSDVSGAPVTGYSVIKADSMEAAVTCASMVPLVVDGSGSCDVYETYDAM
jgi:hypothetical protein